MKRLINDAWTYGKITLVGILSAGMVLINTPIVAKTIFKEHLKKPFYKIYGNYIGKKSTNYQNFKEQLKKPIYEIYENYTGKKSIEEKVEAVGANTYEELQEIIEKTKSLRK